jgi:sporadic carbohydrate cluster protein (TIGR04323 family)
MLNPSIKNKKMRGYIYTRPVGGQLLPQRVQNLVIRTYAQNNGLIFLLSATEFYMDDCYMMYRAIKDELQEIDGVIYYSLEMLPRSPEKRKELLGFLLDAGKEIHFALEEFIVTPQKGLQELEDVFMVKSLAPTDVSLIA